MPTKRPVVFWAWRNRPSFIMRGAQVAEALARRGVSVQTRVGPSRKVLRDVRDSVIVCVKSCPCFAGWLRRRGNRVVYDAIDFTALRGIPAQADIVIAGNEDLRRRLEKHLAGRATVTTIYHHADPFLKPHRAGENAVRLAYIGEPGNSKFLRGRIPELNVVSFKRADWRESIRDFNAHFSARIDPNKSVIKLANVAMLQAVFLTGAEPGCVELLGADYPFFLRDPGDLRTVQEDVRRLKEAIGTDLWREARRRIEEVRPRLTIEATARAYEDLLIGIDP
jgi:hypothetical protein